MNFVAILVAFEAIYTKSYEIFSSSDYEQIPQNKSRMFDFLVRKAKLKAFGREFELDLGLNISEKLVNGELRYRLVLENFGDLQNNAAFHELNGKEISLQIDTEGIADFKNPDGIDKVLKNAEVLIAISDEKQAVNHVYRGMEIGALQSGSSKLVRLTKQNP